MTKEEIFSNVLSLFKNEKTAKARGKDVEYYPGYTIAKEWRDRILIHSESNGFPEHLFKYRSPNMEKKEFEYIKNNFKRVTLPVFTDYLSTIGRATIDSNWSITYQEDDADIKEAGLTLEEYIDEIELEEYWKEIIPSIKTKDANGIIAIKSNFEYLLDEAGQPIYDDEGEIVFDDTKLPSPYPFYYSCDKVLAHVRDRHTLVLTDEHSEVVYGNRKEKSGYVFEYYDQYEIWRIVQVGNKIDWQFEWQLLDRHNWGRVPVMQLLGIPNIMENRIVYQSPFLFATDILDLVLLNSSNLQVSINSCVYPYRVMVGYPCDFENDNGRCDDGQLRELGSGNVIGGCPACGGSGLKDRMSPSGTLLLNPKDPKTGESTMGAGQNHLYYVSPETTTLEFLENKIAQDENKARRIIFLQNSNSNVRGTEGDTALGKAIDEKNKYSFIKGVSQQLFDILEFMIDAIGWQRYGDKYKEPSIVEPVTFDFKTAESYMIELSEAIKNGLPPYVIHLIIYKFVQTYFYSDSQGEQAFKLILATDRIVTLSQEAINTGLSNGTIEKWESILHDSCITFINELLQENPEFFMQEMAMQQEQLESKARLRAEQIAKSEADNTGNLIANIANA